MNINKTTLHVNATHTHLNPASTQASHWFAQLPIVKPALNAFGNAFTSIANNLLTPTQAAQSNPSSATAQLKSLTTYSPANPLVRPKGLDQAAPGSPEHVLSQMPILSQDEIPAMLQALEAESTIGSVLSHEEGLKVLINRFTYEKTSEPFDRPSGRGNTGYVVPPLAYLKQHQAVFDGHRPANRPATPPEKLNIHISDKLPSYERNRLHTALNTLSSTPTGIALLNRANRVDRQSHLVPTPVNQHGNAGEAHYIIDFQTNTGEIHLPDISRSTDPGDQISTRLGSLDALHDASTLGHEVGHKILSPIRLRQDLRSYADYIQGKSTSIDVVNQKNARIQLEENVVVVIENLVRRDLGHPLRYPEYDGGHTKRLVRLDTRSLGEASRQFLARRHANALDAFLSSTRIDPQRFMVLDPQTQQLRPLTKDEYLSLTPLNETRRLPQAVTLNDIKNTHTTIGKQFDPRNPVVQIAGPIDEALIEQLGGQALDLGTPEQPTATYHIAPNGSQHINIALPGFDRQITLVPEHFELILQHQPEATIRIQFDDDASARQAKPDTQLITENFQQLPNPLTGTTLQLHYNTDTKNGAQLSQALNARDFHLFRTYAMDLLKR